MKVKSSEVLKEALSRHIANAQNCTYICPAIQDVETDLRYQHKQEIKSNALQIFQSFMPKTVIKDMQGMQPWWPKGSSDRVETLNKAIQLAIKRGD